MLSPVLETWDISLFALARRLVPARIMYDMKLLLTTLMIMALCGSQKSRLFAGPSFSLHQITEFCEHWESALGFLRIGEL